MPRALDLYFAYEELLTRSIRERDYWDEKGNPFWHEHVVSWGEEADRALKTKLALLVVIDKGAYSDEAGSRSSHTLQRLGRK